MGEPEEIPPSATFVGHNRLILRNILFNFDDEMLRNCLLVDTRWNNVTHVVVASNRRIYQCIVPIFIERLKSFHLMRTQLNIESRTFNESYDNFMEGRGLKGPRAFEAKFLSLLRHSITEPYCVILMDDNFKVDERFCWDPKFVLSVLRPNLPEECAVIGINANYGILGEDTKLDSSLPKDQMTLSSIHCRLFVISGLVFPKYKGVTISTYRPVPEIKNFPIDHDIKALIILTSNAEPTERMSPSWQANAIFDHYQGQLALGGAQVFAKEDREWTNDVNADGHYVFVNGPPPYNDDWNNERASPIVIQFSGLNCRAASLHIERQDPRQSVADELTLIETSLRQFRESLTFECDSSERYESIGFLFFDYDSYRDYTEHSGELNAGVDLFFRIFPKTLVTGILCHSTYRHNFVPETDIQMPDLTANLLSTQGIASFVLIVMKKNEIRF